MRIRYHYEEPFRWFRNIRGIMVVESEPASRTILGGNRYKIFLPFPYVVFVIRYRKTSEGKYVYGGLYDRGLAVYFRNKPLETLDDPVFVAPMDAKRQGYCCTDHGYDGSIYETKEQLMKMVIGIWWGTDHSVDGIWLDEWKNIKPKDVLNTNWPGNSISYGSSLFNNTYPLRKCFYIPAFNMGFHVDYETMVKPSLIVPEDAVLEKIG